MNVQSDVKKRSIQFEGPSEEILRETSPVLSPEERDQIRRERENEGMLEFYGGARLNHMASYLKTNSINKIRSREIYLDLDVDQIRPMPGQPRVVFDQVAMEDLKASIQAKGLSNPILVRRSGEQFELIAGERRWRAFKELGRKKIPAIIKDVKDDKEDFILSAIENLQREDLSVVEEALCYQKMIDTGAVSSQKELAQIVGRTKSKISERLSLLKLPDAVKNMLSVKDAKLSEGHGVELLRLKSHEKIVEMAEKILAADMSRDDLRDEIAAVISEEKRHGAPVDAVSEGKKIPVVVEVATEVEGKVAAGDPSAMPFTSSATIRFMPFDDHGFDLSYRFRPGLHHSGELLNVIQDMNRRMKAFKKLRKILHKRGIAC